MGLHRALDGIGSEAAVGRMSEALIRRGLSVTESASG